MNLPNTNFITNPDTVRRWLDRYCEITGDIYISDTGVVSVTGNVTVVPRDGGVATLSLTHLEVQFEDVSGCFDCSNLYELLSLQGSPRTVGTWFNCSGCDNLESLAGAPDYVSVSFSCSKCPKLLTLEGAPAQVDVGFYCHGCANLTSLQGASQHIGESFDCTNCPKLRTLEGVGTLGGPLRFDKIAHPDPRMVLNLLQQRVKLQTPQKAPWITIVNDYHKSGDLLTAIAQFEKYFKVPFPGKTPAANTILKVPSL